MNTTEYLEKVSYVKEFDQSDGSGDPDFINDCYFSKFNDSYITHVGMEDTIKHLADREITGELTHGVGFSPKENKWFGWSHRAIYGFYVGSTCKKGDCHYKGSNLDEQKEAAINFWTEMDHLNVRSDGVVKQDKEEYFDIKWDYSKSVPNESLRETIGGCLHHIKSCGRGEWTAKTMDDAKQMAVDFNEGVS